MATLVLTTVGTLVGGPIGGAIGAVLGSRIDRGLLAPRRQGPRLGDLSGGGKGGGAATTYSYSASFAVALSSRPIRSVRRIWADGKLLRGREGDWKSDVAAFRLHPGDEDQAVDPLIASAEGLAGAPAHRGLAYAVFDTLQLADFGNRIPSLTFEVEADAAEIDIGMIATALSEGAIVGSAKVSIAGYAAGGESVRGAIEALSAAYPLSISDDGARLRIDEATERVIDEGELGAGVDDKRESRSVRDRQAAAALPDEIALAYYEPERDYQAGLQRARRDGVALRATRIELPAAIGAAMAKGTAEAALMRAWRERERATVRLPWRRLDLRIGQQLTMQGVRWRIAGWTLERMALELALVRSGAPALAAPASPGTGGQEQDASAGNTVIHLLDIPAFDGSGGGDAPRLWLAAAGSGAGWRRATASLSLDGGASWRTVGTTAPAAVMGTIVGAAGGGPGDLIDRFTRIEVALLHDGMSLPSGGDAALITGRNLAVIGDELIAFADATQFAPRRWILSGLLRGRFGTEWAIAEHQPGERFILIEPGRLLPIDFPAMALGGPIAISAGGPGDGGQTASAEATVVGRALRPPSPVMLRAGRLADDTIRISWMRRSRTGWAWLDETDAPLGEESERYRLRLSVNGADHVVETGSATFDYLAGEQPAALLAGTTALTVSVAQLGRFGPSQPATRTFLF